MEETPRAATGVTSKMHVIGHQYVRMDATIIFERRLLQSSEISSVIFLGGKAWLAIVAALNDMLGNSGELEAGEAGHADVRRGGGDASLIRNPGSAKSRASDVLGRSARLVA
jgi:hypothetical protein